MNLKGYELDAESNFLNFEFYSEGPKGKIKKVIQFKKLATPDVQDDIYNLAFGDFNEGEGKIDDLVVSDNKDSEKVLATVAISVLSFMNKYPEALVFARGSTASRTRYYVMGISKNLDELIHLVEIWGGLGDGKWELFKKNRPYKALLVKRR